VAVLPNSAKPAEKRVEDALLNCCRAVQVLAFPKLIPQSEMAPLPSYDEPLSVESLVNAASVLPSEIPEMVELVRPALSRVPEIVGVKVRAPAEGMMVIPSVCPLTVAVEVEKVIAAAVVEAKPEPSSVRVPLPLPTQVPPMAKHPVVKLKPTSDVEVAEPLMLSPERVVVPKPVFDTFRYSVVEPTMKLQVSPASALTESLANGEVEATPTLDPKKESSEVDVAYIAPT
jgi:hypothetical protein